MSVQVTTERVKVGKSGPLNSADMNKFIDSTINDMTNLATQTNFNEVNVSETMKIVLREMANLKQQVSQMSDAADFDAATRAIDNLRINAFHSMADASGISFISGTSNALHPAINTMFGQATVPINGISSKFYTNSIISGSIVPISQNLNITVTPIFDKGSGLQNYEPGSPTVAEGEPKRAFNGNNQSYWIRRLEYDLESDVSEVEVELTIQVPDQANGESNSIYFRSFPVGETDVTALSTAPNLSSSFTTVPGFEAVDNTRDRRYFFSSKQVSQVQVRLRQRNWFEENGKKVFVYGLQELGLQLVEFDRTWDSSADIGANHTFVTKFTCPEGFKFSGLHSFRTGPDFTREDVANRHMHFKIALNPTGSDVRWDSDVHPLPQTNTQGINLGNSSNTIYVVTQLNWVSTADGANPLFEAGSSPILEGIGLQYSVIPE